MIVITINFQGNFPTCVMDGDLERPQVFESFEAAHACVECWSENYRAACASICIVNIDTGETELL